VRHNENIVNKMRKKKSSKIDEGGWLGGDFFDPRNPHSVPRELARKGFLVSASELFGVTAALRDNVFPHYLVSSKSPDSAMEPFMTALRKWSDEYRLGFRWVFDQVLDTLMLWKLFPGVSQLDQPNPPWHPLFHLVKRRLRPENTVPFAFTYKVPTFEIAREGPRDWLEAGGWDVELERRERFVADARQQFEEALKNYCADQERRAAERQLIKAKRSRKSRIPPSVKMKWTVQRQCGAMSFEEIAQRHVDDTEESVDVSTIIKAVTEQFELVGLDDERI